MAISDRCGVCYKPGPMVCDNCSTETKKIKLYIAGPMTGLPEYNYPAFHAAEKQLVEAGYEVESPARDGQVRGWTWQDYMKRGIRQLIECDGVALLPGWMDSRGANTECALAKSLGMPCTAVEFWLEEANGT